MGKPWTPDYKPQVNLFIAAGMRSGSTHIKNCFCRLGLRTANLHYSLEGCWNEEHMVDLDAAQILLPMGGWVFQQHTRAIGRNVPLLKQFKIKPVVTYRNLFDCIISWCASRDYNFGIGGAEHYIFAPLYSPGWQMMDQETKWAWCAYNVIPWYTSHYASWADAEIETLFVNYSTHFSDQAAGLRRIWDWLDPQSPRQPTDAELREIGDTTQGRKMVGKVGRGQDLPQYIKDIVYKHVESWGPLWADRLRKELLDAR